MNDEFELWDLKVEVVGERLGVDMHMVTADTQPLHNIEHCIARCHLSVEQMVATPYASGLSVLVDDEAELGCASIDFGAGTTSIAVFSKGQLVHVDAVAIGGQHITMDIARGLSVRLEEAERIKTMFGSALPSPARKPAFKSFAFSLKREAFFFLSVRAACSRILFLSGAGH